MPKGGFRDICLSLLLIDSVLKKDKKLFFTSDFRRMHCRKKGKKDILGIMS